MTPQEFVNKWANSHLGEKQSAQMHFLDVCRLVGVEMPGGDGKTERGETFVFEQSLTTAGGQGFADVYYENHFGVEYKSPDKYKDLKAAYQQLQRYREHLNNPPLLVVTDINHWEIHSNFPNTEKRVYKFSHADIAARPEALNWLRALFHAPDRLHPGRNTAQVTKEAADAFQLIADNMRGWDAEPTRIAYFLTKLVFCLFAEDVGLLPSASSDSSGGIFTHIIQESRGKSAVFKQYVQNLFVAMNEGGEVLMRDIPYFNGTLFNVVTVEELQQEALDALAKAAALNWSSIEPSIFGTLFERSLDPDKRAQLGAHYTSRDDILLIVEPVLMQPLRYEWDTVQLEAETIRGRYDKARTGRARTKSRVQLLDLRERILKRVRETTVLDPACGSGNFLYVSLQMLMNLEKEIIQHPLWAGLQMPSPEVHPRQMYGIEKDTIAHALASIVVWIGYIQWRQDNGYGQAFAEPILEELEDNIVCKDAILPPIPARPHSTPSPNPSPMKREGLSSNLASSPEPSSPSLPVGEGAGGWGGDWPAVDVIVGNPPFLGGSKMRGELGDEYYERLTDYYDGRLPGFSDLVCYWFEKAREHIENDKAKRAGLLATNSIRGGANREVLKRIKETGDIFMAWSDRDWILDGAAVRVSMVGFDKGTQIEKTFDGLSVQNITPDLTATVDITGATVLDENAKVAFRGNQRGGAFDIDEAVALQFLNATNLSRKSNRDVVKPWWNGLDITRRPRNMWIIDFGTNMSLSEAMKYEAPFQHVQKYVKPVREKNNRKAYRERWWIYNEARPSMRLALKGLERYIATTHTSKHRLFVWMDEKIVPDHALVAIARDDDYFFGVLHSKLHETWSLRMGTSLEDRPRYTPTTTFETFPFPWPPGREDTSHPAHARISAAAKQLHEEREAWLNPPLSTPSPSPSRHLYGEHPKMREGELGTGELAKGDESPSLFMREGFGVGAKWDIPPTLERRMQMVARELRKNPTGAEDKLWQAIRKKQLDGRKFRRQVAIGAFVVDFYCSTERLAVEVDGPIHEQQKEADRTRQELIESLGIRFVRVTNDEVEHKLQAALKKIRDSFTPHPPGPLPPQGGKGELSSDEPAKGDESPSLPVGNIPREAGDRGGSGFGVGAKALKDRTLTNLYNALQVWRGRDDMRVKAAAADFAPRLDELHRELDEAVCDAYDWEYGVLDDEEEILRRLLALNLARAAQPD